MDFFKNRKWVPGFGQKSKVEKTQSTKDLIKDIEDRESKQEVSKGLAGPVELDVLGAPVVDTWSEEERAQFAFKAFPIAKHNAELTIEEVESVLGSSYKQVYGSEGQDLGQDLNKRFAYLKAVMQGLNTAIPEKYIIQFGSVEDVRTYFAGKVVGIEFNEKEPEAIYLNPEDFKGTNITLVDVVKSKKERKQKWDDLINQARKHEDEELAKSLNV